jgi:cell division protein ZapA
MPAPASVSLDVAIMGREFRISCPEKERDSLLQAVSYLDRKMREIRDAGKVIGVERIAIMAALNIAHDYLNKQGAPSDVTEAKARLEKLGSLLDQAIAQQDNLF